MVIGNFASGADISRDISKVAKEVHIASRACGPDTYKELPGDKNNLWMHSEVNNLDNFFFRVIKTSNYKSS